MAKACSFRWNLAYADADTELLWEKNTTRVVVKNGAKTSSTARDLLMKFRPQALYCKLATGIQFF
jgi:hypothetical protein